MTKFNQGKILIPLAIVLVTSIATSSLMFKGLEMFFVKTLYPEAQYANVINFEEFNNNDFSGPKGVEELTPEENERVIKTHQKVTKVGLTELGLERINEKRNKEGKEKLNVKPAKIGKDLEVAVGASGGTSDGSTAPAATELPNYVDNSFLKYFPPIRSQGSLSSCAAFSGTYYAMTYMNALAKDLDAKGGSDDYRFSPKWTYNFLNNGSGSNGTWYYRAYEIGQKNGLMTWSQFPYDSNPRQWNLDTQEWLSALSQRVDQFGYIDLTDTDAGMIKVKQMLNNGYVLNFSTYIDSWKKKNISNDPSTTADDAFVGKLITYGVDGNLGAHAMTVVGYSDDIWTDINSNGVVDNGEKGAFRIANSWGTAWHEAGYSWIAYDALRATSVVVGAPTFTNRTKGWYTGRAHWVTMRANYSPSLVAQFTVNHALRNQLSVSLGSSDLNSTTPTATWVSNYALTYDGGPYAFDGTTAAIDGTFILDLTDLANNSGGVEKRYYLTVTDSLSGTPVTLKDLKIIDLKTNTVLDYTALPKIIDATTNQSYVEYQFTNGNKLPTAVISTDTVSGSVPLTISLSGTNSTDPDGSISSYAWEFGDGTFGSGPVVNKVYNNVGSYTVKLTVTDNQGGKGSTTIVVTANPDPNILTAPTSLMGSVSGSNASLKWTDTSTNEEGFYVERAVKPKGSTPAVYSRVATLGVNTVSYTETITTGSYNYRVQSYNLTTGKVSTYTNVVSVTRRK